MISFHQTLNLFHNILSSKKLLCLYVNPMKYFKVTSITNLQQSRKEVEERFLRNQSQTNKLIKQNHLANYNYNEAQDVVGIATGFVPKKNRVKFGEHRENSKIQGKILDEQLMMKSLDFEHDLEKSRNEDAKNAKNFIIRYPYGKENVRITQSVLEKYKSTNQATILKRFQQQAKQRKQQLKSQKRFQLQSYRKINLYENNSMIIQRDPRRKITSILQRQKKKLEMAKQQYLREVEKSKERQREENKRIRQVESALRDVKEKMDKNFSLILESQNQTERNRKFVREVDFTRASLQKMRAVDRLEATQRTKLPVVVYKNPIAKQQNFVNRSLCLDLMDYQRQSHIEKPQQFQKVLKIYNSNKRRLDKLCQRISVRTKEGSGVVY